MSVGWTCVGCGFLGWTRSTIGSGITFLTAWFRFCQRYFLYLYDRDFDFINRTHRRFRLWSVCQRIPYHSVIICSVIGFMCALLPPNIGFVEVVFALNNFFHQSLFCQPSCCAYWQPTIQYGLTVFLRAAVNINDPNGSIFFITPFKNSDTCDNYCRLVKKLFDLVWFKI